MLRVSSYIHSCLRVLQPDGGHAMPCHSYYNYYYYHHFAIVIFIVSRTVLPSFNVNNPLSIIHELPG